MTTVDSGSHRPGPVALAVVADELERLPRVDDRYRVWPWSLRTLAQRRRCSPGTIHKHQQALAAAVVLVADDQGRTLVDTARLEDVRGAGRPPSASRQRRRSTNWPESQRSSGTLAAAGEADVLAAVEALTSAVEARSDLAGALMPIIGRLARIIEEVHLEPCASSTCPSLRAAGARPGSRGARPRSRRMLL